jgi:hypothetical protein
MKSHPWRKIIFQPQTRVCVLISARWKKVISIKRRKSRSSWKKGNARVVVRWRMRVRLGLRAGLRGLVMRVMGRLFGDLRVGRMGIGMRELGGIGLVLCLFSRIARLDTSCLRLLT